jgi:hypothetical protein
MGKAYSSLALLWSQLLWIPAVWRILREFARPIALVLYKLLLRLQIGLSYVLGVRGR